MFAASVYAARRRALMREVGSGLVLLPGNDLLGMNYRANTFPFRQDGSFLYFVGLNEPDLFLALDCGSGAETLFGPLKNLNDTIWTGPSPSLEDLAAATGVAASGSVADLGVLCRQTLDQGRAVHYLPTYQGEQTLKLSRILGQTPERVEAGASSALIEAVVALRGVKSEDEIAEIRSAIDLSAAMYADLMGRCRPGVSEMELYGRAQGLIVTAGSGEAFPMILSRRGEVLHNHAHDQILEDGDLLLIDSGVRSSRGYASDITRTLPVGGRFSTRQRDIYDVALAALRAGVACVAPGVPFRDCHVAAARTIVEGLGALGLMHGDVDEAVAAGAHALFFPHGLGHMLGLDVHDMESLGEDRVGYDREFRRSPQFGLSGLRLARRLRPGFVLTVEPGVYFIPALIAQWKGQRLHEEFIDYSALDGFLDFGGIRVEDDVLVTDQGAEVLSTAIPKEIAEIEVLMGRGR